MNDFHGEEITSSNKIKSTKIINIIVAGGRESCEPARIGTTTALPISVV